MALRYWFPIPNVKRTTREEIDCESAAIQYLHSLILNIIKWKLEIGVIILNADIDFFFLASGNESTGFNKEHSPYINNTRKEIEWKNSFGTFLSLEIFCV